MAASTHRLRLTLIFALIVPAIATQPSLGFELNEPLHGQTYAGMVLETGMLEGDPCGAILRVDRPRVVETITVGWTGRCEDGLAHGDGELTLYYDDVPMFMSSFKESSGTTMYFGVPLSTLREGDLTVHQSACKDAGWTLGNTRGGAFAEYPDWAQPNYWTFSQDAVIAETAARCGGAYSPLRVMMKGGEVVGVVRGKSYAQVADTLRPGVLEPQLYGHQDVWNEAIDRYNSERERLAAERQAERERTALAALEEKRAATAARYADPNTPIDNIADFIESHGDIKAIEELSKGRRIVVKSPDVAFSSGAILVSFYTSPTSAADAVNDLNNGFSWNKWFDVTMNQNTPLGRRIEVTCRFELGQLDGIDARGEFVAFAKLQQLNGGNIVFDCTRE